MRGRCVATGVVVGHGTIDLGRRVLYEIGAGGDLHALDLATGEERPGWPLRLIERYEYEYVWGGLQLIGGRIYVPVASYCDETDPAGVAADGRLVAVDAAGSAASRHSASSTVTGSGALRPRSRRSRR